LLCQKLKSRVSLIHLKPILDIFLRGFSLSSCPQHSLKVLLLYSRLLLNPTCLFKVCTQMWTEFFIFWSGLSDIRINCKGISEDLLYFTGSSVIFLKQFCYSDYLATLSTRVSPPLLVRTELHCYPVFSAFALVAELALQCQRPFQEVACLFTLCIFHGSDPSSNVGNLSRHRCRRGCFLLLAVLCTRPWQSFNLQIHLFDAAELSICILSAVYLAFTCNILPYEHPMLALAGTKPTTRVSQEARGE
jgi:hypothetical protein